MTDLIKRFHGVCETGTGWTARCPAHADEQNSLSIQHREGRWVLMCEAGCDIESIASAVGLTQSDLFGDKQEAERGEVYPSGDRATVQSPAASGLTLEQCAKVKRLPLNFLRGCGLSEITYEGRSAVRIPYLGPSGELLATRFQIALEGDRFRWKMGSKPQLYGLNRLSAARDAGHVVLVEDEADVLTFWRHDIPALGIPGAGNWRDDRDARHLDGIKT